MLTLILIAIAVLALIALVRLVYGRRRHRTLGDILELAGLERRRWPARLQALVASGVPLNMPYKKSNWTAHLQIDGIDYGEWAVAEGGGKTSENGSYDDYDGPVRLGGKPEREDVTMRKLYRENVHQSFRDLDARVGGGKCTITKVPTDDDALSWGDPIVYTGVLGGCKPPDVDKGSSDGGEIELTIQVDAKLA